MVIARIMYFVLIQVESDNEEKASLDFSMSLHPNGKDIYIS